MLSFIVVSGLCSLLLVCFIFYFRQFRKIQRDLIQTQLQLKEQVAKDQVLSLELNELKENSAHSALKDPLTGLLTRYVFADRLQQTLNQSKRYQLVFGVLFLDIDAFKVINDALGHQVGDALLKEVAERLSKSIRQVDSIGRFSGDEFVFILSQLSKAETAAYVAQRLLDVIAQPFQIQEHEFFITASIGIAVYPADGEDVGLLLKNADIALHQAKARGRNTYQFYREEMNLLSRRELVLSASLQSASVYDEFSLYYQPQVHVETKKIIGLDVTLHWQHPDFGLISLAEFFRLAENNGKIVAIGEWMLRTALQQLAQWKQQDIHMNQVMVTVSVKQLENPHFAYTVSQLLQEMNLEPKSLVLKIPEHMLLRRADIIEKALYMLKHVGVQLAIDEFGGSGFALQYLKRFPVDYLKIDKEGTAIVKMIIALAESLQTRVIVDGIESANEIQLLHELGCQIMQGAFFCGPACSAEELTKTGIAINPF